MVSYIRICESSLSLEDTILIKVKHRWDSSTLKSANAVCRLFHELILPFFFEYVHIHFPEKGNYGRESLQLLAADSKLFQCAKQVVISGFFPHGSIKDVNLLQYALAKCDQLRVFR